MDTGYGAWVDVLSLHDSELDIKEAYATGLS